MAVRDVLENIGSGLKKGAGVAGAVGQEFAPRLAEVLSGEQQEADFERRQQKYKQEDAAIDVQAQQLEAQLEAGRKYGTLTTEQQQQLVNQITGLYSHPRHAPKLMEKIRRIVHPQGAVAQGPMSESLGLPQNVSAFPPQGTYKFEQENKAKSAGGGTSPAITGNYLPPDATGPDGQVIPLDQRTPNRQWKQWGRDGNWYPLAPPKGVFKVRQNRLVLLSPTDGSVIRDLGQYAAGSVSTHQVPMIGDDGLMHLVTTYSTRDPITGEVYTSDQNPTAEVEPTGQETHAPSEPGKLPAAPSKPKAAGEPKQTPKKSNVAAALTPPSGGAAKAGQPGPSIPGSRKAAQAKDPRFKAASAILDKAKQEYIAAKLRQDTMDENLKAALAGDQQAMLSLVANHIGMTLGTQKGARITRAVWDEAIQSAPWISVQAAKWFHEDANGDMIFDGFKSGVTITGEQARQMVNLAHEKVRFLDKTIKETQAMFAEELEGGAQTVPSTGKKAIVVSPEDMK